MVLSILGDIPKSSFPSSPNGIPYEGNTPPIPSQSVPTQDNKDNKKNETFNR